MNAMRNVKLELEFEIFLAWSIGQKRGYGFVFLSVGLITSTTYEN